MKATNLFSFPNPVNEVSARLAAGGVVLMSALTIALERPWPTVVIAYGFIARMLTGPTLSPLGQLVTRVLTPLLRAPPRPVPGPPKRFAQGIGAAFSVTSALLALAFGLKTAAFAVLALLPVAAALEALLGVCLGCAAFSVLVRCGVIAPAACESCCDAGAGLPERA